MNHLHQALERKLQALPVGVSVVLPSGQALGPDTATVRLRLRDIGALGLLATGRVGALGEAVVEGRLVIEGGMRELMAVVVALLPDPVRADRPRWWSRLALHRRSRRQHSRKRDAEQIAFHYDVSDDFYALWLDPRRVYSCAYYREDGMDLRQAQEAKLDHICRKLDLRPGERFLDVGAGWGGLLLWAAQHYGVEATGITLSHNQHAYVQGRIRELGLAGRARMFLMDYRALEEAQPFDKIASIGMFEHVGRAQLPAYFGKLHALLRPGGLLLNHGITAGGLDNAQVGGGLGDFIEKYIFPGGELVHASVVAREIAAAGMEAVDVENLRPHYARTLWAWSDALEAHLAEAGRVLSRDGDTAAAGKILRAYRLYLAGCAVAFEQRWVSVHQCLATRPDGQLDTGAMRGAQSSYPFRRDHIYARRRAATEATPA